MVRERCECSIRELLLRVAAGLFVAADITVVGNCPWEFYFCVTPGMAYTYTVYAMHM